ncbi:MAG: replication initiation protein [Hymenobacter sp.]|nr:replication initiation protein [Hymenobacter sp.]
MRVHTSNDPEIAFLSTLFVRFPLAFSQVEARLFALALSSLPQESRQVTFQLTSDNIIPDGNADDQQYNKLLVAIERLLKGIDDKVLWEEKGIVQFIQLFSRLGLNPGAGLITGMFNPDLREYLLHLSGKYTTAELEALLMQR